MEQPRPEIHIHYTNEDKRYRQEILAGIEEEGLYCHCYPKSISDPTLSAYKAARSSLLGVGIAIKGHEVVLHMRDLRQEEPLMHIKTEDKVIFRTLGSNAARYIKGIPFKDMDIDKLN